MHHVKLILLFSLCIWMSANAQTPYDSFAPETSRPILTSEALSKEKCAQDFSSDTTLLVAMIDTQQERILLVDMSDRSIVAYAPLTDNANTGNNIMNAFVHETKHAIDGNTSETDAILQQIVHPTWNKTTASFQHGVINYLVNNANKKQLSVYNPSIKQIQSVLKQSAYSIFYHDGKFSILLQPRK